MVAAGISSVATAQSLSEKLIAEEPVRLAEQSRQDGDIVRGAILFHQGNINCAKCHRSKSDQNRFGPDLRRMEPETSDESIIESILQPSRQIREGYETYVVQTLDGQIISGIKVREDDRQVVIRDRDNVDNLIVIDRDDVEQIRPGNESSMPSELVDQLKNRQQFLDLLCYVLDLKERGPDSGLAATAPSKKRELASELKGLLLLQKYNCVACHQSDSVHPSIAAKQPPRLKWSVKNLNPDYLEEFIANPHGVKPGSTMPDVLANSLVSNREEAAAAITHFLMSKSENIYQSQPAKSDAVGRGFELFHSVGCVACHSPRTPSGEENWLDDSAPLGDISRKYGINSLTEFLQDPLAVRSSGHMPDMQLAHREAVDIANFLLQSAPTKNVSWKLDVELIPQGELLFKQLRCASCHADFAGFDKFVANGLSLDRVNPMQGCLGAQPGDWPDFHLNPSEREEIASSLRQFPLKPDNQERIEMTLSSLNCLACHHRDGLGGVSPQRSSHFQTTNLNLGDQGRIPPTLTGVGAKLERKWMRDVMVNRRSIRPYMKTRMPQFGEKNVGHLFELFEASDRMDEVEHAHFEDQKAMREKGHMLAGNKGLNCVACHTYQYKTSDTMPAVDLTEMTERLKKDWFYQYMLAPQSFSPNTVMPSFWPDGNAIRQDIEGTSREQIEALWQYLIDGRQARAPRGVVREPLEILVKNEARMLRRKYPSIGKRGIGVGYPGDMNIAFDAEQLRLGAIWRGKFAEASGVWRGQGSGNVRPLGPMIQFVKGPELDHVERPWVVDDSRPPNHVFKGYSLDRFRRPKFRYEFGSVRVEDYFVEILNEDESVSRLRRVVAIRSSQQVSGLRFRVAESAKLSSIGDGIFAVEMKLKVKIASDHETRTETIDDRRRVNVLLDVRPDEEQKLVIEYSWN